jgi:hypothetical protein
VVIHWFSLFLFTCLSTILIFSSPVAFSALVANCVSFEDTLLFVHWSIVNQVSRFAMAGTRDPASNRTPCRRSPPRNYLWWLVAPWVLIRGPHRWLVPVSMRPYWNWEPGRCLLGLTPSDLHHPVKPVARDELFLLIGEFIPILPS